VVLQCATAIIIHQQEPLLDDTLQGKGTHDVRTCKT
jgi:hypothetical protein